MLDPLALHLQVAQRIDLVRAIDAPLAFLQTDKEVGVLLSGSVLTIHCGVGGGPRQVKLA